MSTRENIRLIARAPFYPRVKSQMYKVCKKRISEILAWDISSYLSHVILPRLSLVGCSLVIGTHAHGGQVISFLCQ